MMPPEDLEAVCARVLRVRLPYAAPEDIAALAQYLAQAIVARDEQLATAYRGRTRAQLLDALAIEAQAPLPRREVGASLPNLDTPDVVAARLALLAQIPVSAADDPAPTGQTYEDFIADRPAAPPADGEGDR